MAIKKIFVTTFCFLSFVMFVGVMSAAAFTFIDRTDCLECADYSGITPCPDSISKPTDNCSTYTWSDTGATDERTWTENCTKSDGTPGTKGCSQPIKEQEKYGFETCCTHWGHRPTTSCGSVSRTISYLPSGVDAGSSSKECGDPGTSCLDQGSAEWFCCIGCCQTCITQGAWSGNGETFTLYDYCGATSDLAVVTSVNHGVHSQYVIDTLPSTRGCTSGCTIQYLPQSVTCSKATADWSRYCAETDDHPETTVTRPASGSLYGWWDNWRWKCTRSIKWVDYDDDDCDSCE